MNILLFIDSLAGGGSQRQLANLAVGLQARGYNVTVATYAPIEDHLSRITSAGVNYICLNKGSRFDLKPAFKLAKLMRKEAPTAAVAFLRTPAIYAELARIQAPSVPLIVSERAGLLNGNLRVSDKIGSILHLLANGVVANSQAYADGMTAFLPRLKKSTSIIYNGVENNFFINGQTRISRDKNTPAADSSGKRTRFCIVAARPTEEKGLRILAQALGIVAAQGLTNISVDWIGPADNDEPEVQATDLILKEHKLVSIWHWVGHKQNILESYNDYDALICPSLHEGVPNVVCEAMACALPVIVTDVGDNKHIVKAPDQGFVCEANNPQSLAEGIVHFLTTDQQTRTSMGESAHHRAKKLFSMHNYLDSWEAVIKGVQ